MPRHFLKDSDLTSTEQAEVLRLALEMRDNRFNHRPFTGPRTVAVMFDKPSTRTRVSFATGVAELGGHPLVLDTATSQMGRGEPIEDTARVLSRQVSTIVWRTYAQESLERMAAYASVPVINALSNDFHPCQALADLATIALHRGGIASDGPALAGGVLTYTGDGANNMAHSYLLAGALAGMQVRIAAPPSHHPHPKIWDEAQQIAERHGGSVHITTSLEEAASGAHVIATDTWVSMEHDAHGRTDAVFGPYRVTSSIMNRSEQALFLHCLPAYRGKEVTAEVLESDASVVWDEAEMRLHAQKALMTWLIDHPDDATAAHARPSTAQDSQ